MWPFTKKKDQAPVSTAIDMTLMSNSDEMRGVEVVWRMRRIRELKQAGMTNADVNATLAAEAQQAPWRN